MQNNKNVKSAQPTQDPLASQGPGTEFNQADGDAYLQRLFDLKRKAGAAKGNIESMRKRSMSSASMQKDRKKAMLNQLFASFAQAGYDLTDPASVQMLVERLKATGQDRALEILLSSLDPDSLPVGNEGFPEGGDLSSVMGMVPGTDLSEIEAQQQAAAAQQQAAMESQLAGGQAM